MKARTADSTIRAYISQKASSLARSLSLLNRKKHPAASRAGFTIVELLIVIVVIAILAAISIVAYTGIQNRAREATIASKETQARKALEVYKVENDRYPTSQSEFDSLIGQQSGDDPYTMYSSSSPYDTYTISTGSGGTVALSCEPGFIPVPGNSSLGTSNFCVMKYEAKNVGGTATSQAAGNPWVSISQTNAITAANNACDGCGLITEAQWMTIAANVLSVPSNWSGGSVGSGYIYSGHNDNSPANALSASSSDSDGYSGTGNSSPSNQRRTLTLTNGEVIWDFAGNVREWTTGTITGAQPTNGTGGYAWRQYSAITNWGNLPAGSRPAAAGAGSWNASHGIGQIYSNGNETGTRAFFRGGSWYDGSNAGVLSLILHVAPSLTYTGVGFRASQGF